MLNGSGKFYKMWKWKRKQKEAASRQLNGAHEICGHCFISKRQCCYNIVVKWDQHVDIYLKMPLIL